MLTKPIKPYLNGTFINIIGISYHNTANFIIVSYDKNINLCAIKFSNQSICRRVIPITFFFQFTYHLSLTPINRNSKELGNILLRMYNY